MCAKSRVSSSNGRFNRFGCHIIVSLVLCASAVNVAAQDHIFSDSFERISKVAQPDVEIALADDTVWTSLKARCDRDLNTLISDIYAGFDWRQAAQDYGLCYNVGTLRGDPKAPLYSKKAVAMLKTLARNFPVIRANQNHQFLAFGDDSTKVFALPMVPLAGKPVRVFSNTAAVSAFTYTGPIQPDVTPEFDSAGLYPVLRISNTKLGATSNAPAEYVKEVDWHVSMRQEVNGNSEFDAILWLGARHPAGTYYVSTNQNGNDTEIAASNFSVTGSTLTFNTAPAAGKTLFVQYIGSDYTQTSNSQGGLESVKPDGPGYNMRAMNVGLAYGYDAIRQSPDLTSSLRQEFYSVLNSQIDWYTATGYEGPNLYEDPVGNYYIRGYLTGVMFTAYATDSENPRALSSGDLKPLARMLLMQTFQKMGLDLSGGYGPQGTYSEGTNGDMLQLYDLWKRLTTSDGAPEDLASQLEWTTNLVPATIHGTKPDRVTFYDGGDWNELPATPLVASMQAFIKYQPNHPMAPYARQLLDDVGYPVSGVTTDYKSGQTAFPLSYLAKVTSPMYARSDWSNSAVWLSLASGPIVEGHQHLDQGHLTLQRGADYLLINSGGYGLFDTLPWHNTLGFDDRGAGNHSVYPPGQGDWGDRAKISRYEDQGGFVYAEADIADAYVNNDGVANSVQSALRTLVYIRPNIVFLHDETQVANPAVKKIFNLNFNAPSLARTGNVFSMTRGASKLFVRALTPGNPTPVTTNLDYNNGSNNATNYQITTVGQAAGTFLHLFELAGATQTSMSSSSYVVSTDAREQGAEVDLGSRRWIVLASTGPAPASKATALKYSVPQACPCTHVVTNLPPSTTYQVIITGGAGGTIPVSSDAKGVLTFQTDDAGTTAVQLN